MSVIAFIPARGGSKSIPEKNIKSFCGKPLIYWNLHELQKSDVDEIVVATDSDNIKSVVGRRLQWKPIPINTLATTTITVKGNVSGITKTVTVTPIPVTDSGVSPLNTNQVNVTDPNF